MKKEQKSLPEEVRQHLAEIGRKGGQSKSEKKLKALDENRKKRTKLVTNLEKHGNHRST